MDYSEISERIAVNGEPGLAWLSNMQAYSRMRPDEELYVDSRAGGGNPCLEQTLESYETCCLVETFPNNHNTLQDYLKTLEQAFLFGKTITLCKSHWSETNEVQFRNRRVGTSMSGVTQFIANRGLNELKGWCEEGYSHLSVYDKQLSEKLKVTPSKKMTSIKPSGTISLLAGATPGCHFPESRCYIRRIRIPKDNNKQLLESLKECGFFMEDDVCNPSVTVVEFPVEIPEKNIRVNSEVSMWEKLHLAAFLQEHWSDNQVSCTVSFSKEEASEIKQSLNYFQHRLKGISFLPRLDEGEREDQMPYEQMPYEKISKEEYEQLCEVIDMDKLHLGIPSTGVEPTMPEFCTNDFCEVK
jgi:hypothetical protein